MTSSQPAGNYYDKYSTKNPIARWLMGRFFESFDALVDRAGPVQSALEVGCGEGELSIRIAKATNAEICAFDVSPSVVEEARVRADLAEVGERIQFRTESVYDLSFATDRADLVVCCEVLEHLQNPEMAIDRLAEVCGSHLIASVPREPLWRALNLARGKYWRDFGNTPGHLQHWSALSFRQMLDRRFEIVELRTPLPWTMALCRPRRR
jgi:2-polyprenyl-3-methyl-5-hydroxy-6-metoxy-1,4-benzoquinol methylase